MGKVERSLSRPPGFLDDDVTFPDCIRIQNVLRSRCEDTGGHRASRVASRPRFALLNTRALERKKALSSLQTSRRWSAGRETTLRKDGRPPMTSFSRGNTLTTSTLRMMRTRSQGPADRVGIAAFRQPAFFFSSLLNLAIIFAFSALKIKMWPFLAIRPCNLTQKTWSLSIFGTVLACV